MSNLSVKEKLELYKKIIKEPYKKSGYIWYEVEFSSLYELYRYLSMNPQVNMDIFKDQRSLMPLSTNLDFFEMEYDEALECLVGKYDKPIQELLKLRRDLSKTIYFPSLERNVVKALSGSRICLNSFITNNPKRFYRLERELEKKFITIHVNLSYNASITKDQILNRGALIYNLVKMLEDNNYVVELKTFVLLKISDEICYIKVRLKNRTEKFNLKNGVFPLLSVDFNRRIIFRVIESLNVKNTKWGTLYGSYINDFLTKELLSLSENDIYVPAPSDLGIEGMNLRDDIDSFLDYVNIKKYVNVNIK